MRKKMRMLAAAAALVLGHAVAGAETVSFTELTGLTGGTFQGTGVYRADLSTVGLGSILSISIGDNSSGLGGAPGAFSGFDLDAIKLSTTECASAACVQGLAGLGVFDFGAGTLFTPGAQRAPVDPQLFGTGLGGTTVDNTVATLGSFDAESTTGPSAFGFISLGDNGSISFNLLSAVSTAGLFLYIGEVGNNGEVAAGTVRVSDNQVPLPSSLALAVLGLAILLVGRSVGRSHGAAPPSA